MASITEKGGERAAMATSMQESIAEHSTKLRVRGDEREVRGEN